ncbi:MAG: NAD(P)H-binding protein [Firmicutes bacterium]|nr:NAD(P)H-binding protein [Alicyclobacillaceae bacterium]MCL6497859.1 NAD(P)H-binding protein [Bacillota bacterium]
MRVVVTGGTGYLGQGVTRALVAAGHDVKVIARHSGPVPEGARLVTGDLLTMDLTDALAGADAVVHLVGIIREDPARGQTFEVVHTNLTYRLLQTMQAADVRRLVHVSALGTRERAKSRYHQTKWLAESLVREMEGLRYTILRPSLVFGHGAPFFHMVAQMVRLPVCPLPATGGVEVQPVFRDDLARLVERCLVDEETVGKTYEVGGPERFTYRALYQTVARAWRRPEPLFFPVPLDWLETGARIGQWLPGFPITYDQVLMLREPNVTDDERWIAVAEVRPTPLGAVGQDL